MNISTLLYDLLSSSLTVPVYIAGAVESAPSVIVEFPITTGDQTLDNRLRETSVVTLRIHTLHQPDTVNTKQALDLLSAVREVFEKNNVFSKTQTYVGPPEITNQQYEHEGQTAYDILAKYEFKVSASVLEDIYTVERITANWDFLIGSGSPDDIVKVTGSNKSSYLSGNDFNIDPLYDNTLFVFDGVNPSSDINVNLSDDPAYPQRWKIFLIRINSTNKLILSSTELYPSNSVNTENGNLVSAMLLDRESGVNKWAAVGNTNN